MTATMTLDVDSMFECSQPPMSLDLQILDQYCIKSFRISCLFSFSDPATLRIISVATCESSSDKFVKSVDLEHEHPR